MSLQRSQVYSGVTRQEAAGELLVRRRARRALIDFTRYTFAKYKADAAHELIARTLDQVVNGDIRRLMISAPPQHGKSELVSVRLPAFWLGNRPDEPVILASYAASLAASKSRHARAVVESKAFERLFGVRTRRDSRAVDHWEIEGRRGGMLAVGVGGPITGHGAMLGLIDDPVENWEQAQSQTYRDKVWEWYRTTFRTRVWEGGTIVLVMTRWHPDDLAGRILADQAAEWTVLRLPALAEGQAERDENNRYLGLPAGQADPIGRGDGEPLCPGRFSKEALLALKRDVGSVAWAGEYQGVPRAPEGNRFKREWFKIVDAIASGARYVRYWDKAGTAAGGDYTAGVLMAAQGGQYWIVDVVRGQWSALQREQVMKQTSEVDRQRYGHVTTWMEEEGGSGGKESAEASVRALAGFAVRCERVTGSKEVRAEPLAAQCEAGNVLLVRGNWNGAFIDEITAFPNGTNDDQVDGASGSFNKLAAPRYAARAYHGLVGASGQVD